MKKCSECKRMVNKRYKMSFYEKPMCFDCWENEIDGLEIQKMEIDDLIDEIKKKLKKNCPHTSKKPPKK